MAWCTICEAELSTRGHCAVCRPALGEETESIALPRSPGKAEPTPEPLRLTPRLLAPGEFTPAERLGQGGMGVVEAAGQRTLGRRVALKRLREERVAARAEEARALFLTEAAATAELNHPNIVSVFDLVVDELGELCLVMKLIEGVRWESVLRERELLANLEILLRVAEAMAYAHTRGILHMDLKPENVMVGAFGEVQVIDWGCARSLHRGGRVPWVGDQDRIVGTPAYMPPEMARADFARIDARSEVFQLGALLYEIVEHQPPRPGLGALDRLAAARENRIRPPEHPGELIEIALRAMASVPEQRYPDVQALIAVLRDYLEHRESYALSREAERSLAEAKASGAYTAYARALFANEEAIQLWDGNVDAAEALPRIRAAYAEAALARGDLDLAASIAPPAAPLEKRITEALAKREHRQRRYRLLHRMTAGLTAAVILILTLAVTLIYLEKERVLAAQQRERATAFERDQALQDASSASASARVARLAFAERLAGEARASLARGELETARKHVSEIRERFADWPVGPYLEGLIAHARGDTPQALALLQEALARVPQDGQIASALCMVAEASSDWGLLRTQDLPERRGRLDATALAALGEAYLASGAWEAAADRLHLARQALVETSPAELRRSIAARRLRLELRRRNPALRTDPGLKWREGRLIEMDARNLPLADLSPLMGQPVEVLLLEQSAVRDLTPLRRLPLRELNLALTPIADLTPLKGLRLEALNLMNCPVTDLTPLAGMPLKQLILASTEVTDLAPLAGMPLESLSLSGTDVADLTPLQGAPLAQLTANRTLIRDLTPLSGMPLAIVGLKETPITSIAPLAEAPLLDLTLAGSGVDDLIPLAGKHLRTLDLRGCIFDVAALERITVENLLFSNEDRIKANLGVIRGNVREILKGAGGD